jgi:hypothetical protein
VLQETGLIDHVTVTNPLPTYEFLKERYNPTLQVQCGLSTNRVATFMDRVSDLEDFIKHQEMSPAVFMTMLIKLQELRDLSPESSFSVQSGINLPYRLLYMFILYDGSVREAERDLKEIQSRAHLTPRELLVQEYIDAWDAYEDCLVDLRSHMEFVRSYLLTQSDRFTQSELISLNEM